MAVKVMNPISWLASRIPLDRGSPEAAALSVLKLAFWAALLAPVVILPAYFLLVAYGLAPPIHLPSG
ncbi:MAG: hypothetical protein JRN06_07860 [Nitrososphaerota archaeon]|nr:hypothetical protein [Nitrososphaerota archaeon]MDG7024303.1 hypothetical protein [Nitrososphaerota archaeon]